MATLSDTASANIAWVIRYITESNGLEKPNFDLNAIDTLARDYAEYGYTRQIQFLEDFRDRPFWALTNALLYLDSVSPALYRRGTRPGSGCGGYCQDKFQPRRGYLSGVPELYSCSRRFGFRLDVFDLHQGPPARHPALACRGHFWQRRCCGRYCEARHTE